MPMVKKGFVLSGVAPYDADRILSYCNMEVSAEELQTCKEAVPVLAEWVREGNYITEEKLDEMNIRLCEKDKKSRLRHDQLKDSSLRALIINDGSLQSLRAEQAVERKQRQSRKQNQSARRRNVRKRRRRRLRKRRKLRNCTRKHCKCPDLG